jgi:farnesyl diphosphate synthase
MMASALQNQIPSFEDELIETAKLIDAEIVKLLPKSAGFGATLHEAMAYSALSPGKRFRGFLILKSAEIFNVPFENAVRVASAVEMLHSYSLIHDDLPAMDDAEMRRGKKSTHLAFDEATAILAGDSLLTICFEILADPKTHINAEVRADLILRLTKAVGPDGMALGQMMDMEAETSELSFDQMQELQVLKTGKLIEFSAIAGPLMAGASEETLKAFQSYGYYLGKAFQITDDILDETGSDDQIGKPVGQDKEKGKQSFISFLGLDQARVEATLCCEKANQALQSIGEDCTALEDLAHYTIERKK